MDRKTFHKAEKLVAQIDAYAAYIQDIDSCKEDVKFIEITLHMPGSMSNMRLCLDDKKHMSSILQTVRDVLSRDYSDKQQEMEEL